MGRHPMWYIPDGSAVFVVESTLYKLHPHLLSNVSETFKHMFQMPPGINGQCEGLTDETPISLQSPITAAKFEHLLEWFYSEYSQKRPADFTLEALDAVLELSSFLIIESGCDFAVEELKKRRISPICKLLLGQKHNAYLSEWIPDAFRALLATPPDVLSFNDYQELGLHNTFILYETRSKISAHRKTVAFTAPAIQHDYEACTRLRECSEAWSAAWWGGFARHYIHPDCPSSPEDALMKLESAVVPNVTPECQSKTFLLIATKGVLGLEESFIAEAIKQLQPRRFLEEQT